MYSRSGWALCAALVILAAPLQAQDPPVPQTFEWAADYPVPATTTCV